MGPGILSDTTGRGAKSRINYMTWDRWKDASWVRWHKLLPEKQGGWQYQELTGSQGQVVPAQSPVLLLHFDGSNGQESTIDSSLYAWPVTMPGVNGALSTTNPKFGTACLSVPDFVPFSSAPPLYVPFVAGDALDVFTLSTGWTIEFFALATYQAGSIYCYAVNYGGSATTGYNPGKGLFIRLGDNGNGTIACDAVNNGAFTSGSSIGSDSIAGGSGAWHHVAVVNNGTHTTIYLDGTAVGTPSTVWNAAEYTGPAASPAVVIGAFGGYNGATQPCLIDEMRVSPYAVYTGNFMPPTGPFPNPTFPPVQYLGVCRAVHDWSSIDGQYWIALGTHLKLYVINQLQLYDITPDRMTDNVVNAIATTSGSNVVTITDAGHKANTNDFVDISGANAVGGLTISGDYQVSVIDPNTYTIVASIAASATATGGGNFSIAYEISVGLPANGELLGYGTSTYGALTYGTPRAAGTGVAARMRNWSIDNYGEDLIASQTDGEIYWWQKANGPNSPAALIPLAPTGCQKVIVDAQQRVIIAIGCTDTTDTYDAMLVRWCSFDDITDWVPTDVNTAGDDLLTAGSRLITGLKTKGQNLIFSDTTLYRMQFVGGTDIYDFYPAGQVTIVGPNAAVDVDGVAYFMGFDNFYNYSGTLNLQSCDVWETVFDPNVSTSLLRSQSEAVQCFSYEPKTEITWLYPSIGGVQTITFSGNIAQGAKSANLAANWTGQTGYYNVQWSDQESQPVFLTQGSTTATWELPLTGPVTATANTIDNDRYVTYNWEDGTWYYGAWNRTAAAGRAPAMSGYPYGVNYGFLYQHETGTDAVEAYGTNAIGFYMKSLDITIGGAKSEYTMGGSDARFAVGGSDAHLRVLSIIPDFAYFTGSMNITLSTKDRPQDPNYVVNGPVAFTSGTDQIDIDAHGSQVVIQFDNYTGINGAPSLGCSFRQGILQGLALPYAKR